MFKVGQKFSNWSSDRGYRIIKQISSKGYLIEFFNESNGYQGKIWVPQSFIKHQVAEGNWKLVQSSKLLSLRRVQT